MAVDYGIAKKLLLVGFNVETVDGTDPLEAGTVTARKRWPGQVQSRSFTEDYGFEQMTPVGSQIRSPLTVVKKGQHYEAEVVSHLNSVDEAMELIASVAGTYDSGTGIVTIEEPIPSLTIESGMMTTVPNFYLMKGCKIQDIGFSGRMDDLIIMTTKLIARILDGDNEEPVKYGDGGFTSLDELIQPGFQGAHFKHMSFTFKFSFQKETIVIAGFEDGAYDITINGTLFSYTASTETSEEAIRDALVAAINLGSEPVSAAPGASTDDLVITATNVRSFTIVLSAPGASTMTRTSSGTLTDLSPQPEVGEWDLGITNVLIEKKTSGNQSHDVRAIIEGTQRITFGFKILRENNDLLIISRQDPDQPEGQIYLEWIVNHIFGRAENEGFYLKMTMDTCNIFTHEMPEGTDVDFAEEGWAGVVRGDPSLIKLKR